MRALRSSTPTTIASTRHDADSMRSRLATCPRAAKRSDLMPRREDSISGFHSAAHALAVYASQPTGPLSTTQDSLPPAWLSQTDRVGYLRGTNERFPTQSVVRSSVHVFPLSWACLTHERRSSLRHLRGFRTPASGSVETQDATRRSSITRHSFASRIANFAQVRPRNANTVQSFPTPYGRGSKPRPVPDRSPALLAPAYQSTSLRRSADISYPKRSVGYECPPGRRARNLRAIRQSTSRCSNTPRPTSRRTEVGRSSRRRTRRR